MIQFSRSKIILSLTGKTCSGKNYLLTKLLETGLFSKLVTTTTREPRETEVRDEDYYFVDFSTAESYIYDERFFEYTLFKNQIYGITTQEISSKLSLPTIPCVILTPDGVSTYRSALRAKNIRLVSVFVDVDDDTIFDRLAKRTLQEVSGSETEAIARQKMKVAFERVVSIQSVEVSWKSIENWDYVLRPDADGNLDLSFVEELKSSLNLQKS